MHQQVSPISHTTNPKSQQQTHLLKHRITNLQTEVLQLKIEQINLKRINRSLQQTLKTAIKLQLKEQNLNGCGIGFENGWKDRYQKQVQKNLQYQKYISMLEGNSLGGNGQKKVRESFGFYSEKSKMNGKYRDDSFGDKRRRESGTVQNFSSHKKANANNHFLNENTTKSNNKNNIHMISKKHQYQTIQNKQNLLPSHKPPSRSNSIHKMDKLIDKIMTDKYQISDFSSNKQQQSNNKKPSLLISKQQLNRPSLSLYSSSLNILLKQRNPNIISNQQFSKIEKIFESVNTIKQNSKYNNTVEQVLK